MIKITITENHHPGLAWVACVMQWGNSNRVARILQRDFNTNQEAWQWAQRTVADWQAKKEDSA